MFSNNRAVNLLAAARIFLFASRDVWFVVGLPVFLRTEQGWSFWQVGAFLGRLGDRLRHRPGLRARACCGRARRTASRPAAPRPGSRSCSRRSRPRSRSRSRPSVDPSVVVVVGLIAFGVVFALNSAVHSYLILPTPTATRSR